MSEQKRVTRREFLRVASLAGGATVLAACAPGTAAPTEAPAAPAATTAPAVVGKPFEGKTLRMHAISGANYDELYKLTGDKNYLLLKQQADTNLQQGYYWVHGTAK